MGLSLIFIAHDLAVVKYISDRVLVMPLGHAVELGTYDEVYPQSLHPYTSADVRGANSRSDLEKPSSCWKANCRRRLIRHQAACSVRAHWPGRVRNTTGSGRQFPACGFCESRPGIIAGLT